MKTQNVLLALLHCIYNSARTHVHSKLVNDDYRHVVLYLLFTYNIYLSGLQKVFTVSCKRSHSHSVKINIGTCKNRQKEEAIIIDSLVILLNISFSSILSLPLTILISVVMLAFNEHEYYISFTLYFFYMNIIFLLQRDTGRRIHSVVMRRSPTYYSSKS